MRSSASPIRSSARSCQPWVRHGSVGSEACCLANFWASARSVSSMRRTSTARGHSRARKGVDPLVRPKVRLHHRPVSADGTKKGSVEKVWPYVRIFGVFVATMGCCGGVFKWCIPSPVEAISELFGESDTPDQPEPPPPDQPEPPPPDQPDPSPPDPPDQPAPPNVIYRLGFGECRHPHDERADSTLRRRYAVNRRALQRALDACPGNGPLDARRALDHNPAEEANEASTWCAVQQAIRRFSANTRTVRQECPE